jgi:hypothetical protein
VRTGKSFSDPLREQTLLTPTPICPQTSAHPYQRGNAADRACGDITEAVDVGAGDVSVGNRIEVGVVDVVFVADDCKGGFGERG